MSVGTGSNPCETLVLGWPVTNGKNKNNNIDNSNSNNNSNNNDNFNSNNITI